MNINIPTSSSEILLKDYIKFKAFLNSNKEITDKQANRKAVEIFCKLTSKEVGLIPHKDYQEIVNALNSALTEESKELIRIHNGLGFIPCIDDITAAEYADIEELWDEDETNIVEVMNVLYRPIKHKIIDDYEIEDYTDKINNEIYNLPLNVVKSSLGFFLTLREQLLDITLRYSQQPTQETQPTSN